VGPLVGAARRLYYIVHSHRRADGNTGNTRHARMRLVPTPERDDGLLQNRGYRRRTPLRIAHPAVLCCCCVHIRVRQFNTVITTHTGIDECTGLISGCATPLAWQTRHGCDFAHPRCGTCCTHALCITHQVFCRLGNHQPPLGIAMRPQIGLKPYVTRIGVMRTLHDRTQRL